MTSFKLRILSPCFLPSSVLAAPRLTAPSEIDNQTSERTTANSLLLSPAGQQALAADKSRRSPFGLSLALAAEARYVGWTMEASEVRGIVQAEFSPRPERILYSRPLIPWPNARVESDVASLRNALVEPRLATVRIGKTGAGSDLAPRDARILGHHAARRERLSHRLRDPESREFGLAVTGEGDPETVSVWGDPIGNILCSS